ncbi:uroporphyrinogen-III C-methyltransferase [Pseudanabaena sp. FACHB-2040]|uniref:uroporphyrinogen-III C-methyltransferase n=1 Tax=Pseudanabaena sp. FACHB-2040 TaxID=2692859 RepID=UPI001683872D|nr:uroporphyrinogen-III C-methyltransferase [Pseudanabaena sp. FACHB-2040]
MTTGKVYLVGAGPGDLAYLTLRGYQVLGQAEALVHDALVNSDWLALLPPTCEQFDVGKRGGQPSPPQTEIDRLLVDLCQQGRQVVRLKSGDPFIFGRTTSEIQALKGAGCAFEVVPGLSSALAAPLLAGIPLTDSVWGHGFSVVTAHDMDLLDWRALAQIQTVVVLMGARNLGAIAARLRASGKRPETPVAVIRWAGQPQQQVWQGTLLNIDQVTKGEKLSPCVIVIGEVVGLRPYLMGSERPALTMSELGSLANTVPPAAAPAMPLTGKTILVTRSLGQSSQFTKLLQAQGAQVVEMPALEICPPSSWAELDDAIAHLSRFNWLILTSANGVNYFLERLLAAGKDVRSLAGIKIAVVGKKTAAVLGQWGLAPDFVPPDFVADALVEHFPEPVDGLKVLFPRVESGSREVLIEELTAAGAQVVAVAAYESGCPRELDPQAIAALQSGSVDVVTFASSKTVRHFSALVEQGLGPDWLSFLAEVAIASIGPQTSITCQELLGRVDIEAAEYTLDGLTEAISTWAGSGSSV